MLIIKVEVDISTSTFVVVIDFNYGIYGQINTIEPLC